MACRRFSACFHRSASADERGSAPPGGGTPLVRSRRRATRSASRCTAAGGHGVIVRERALIAASCRRVDGIQTAGGSRRPQSSVPQSPRRHGVLSRTNPKSRSMHGSLPTARRPAGSTRNASAAASRIARARRPRRSLNCTRRSPWLRTTRTTGSTGSPPRTLVVHGEEDVRVRTPGLTVAVEPLNNQTVRRRWHPSRL